jgi:hypothetical protein
MAKNKNKKLFPRKNSSKHLNWAKIMIKSDFNTFCEEL